MVFIRKSKKNGIILFKKIVPIAKKYFIKEAGWFEMEKNLCEVKPPKILKFESAELGKTEIRIRTRTSNLLEPSNNYLNFKLSYPTLKNL